jgi:hypothetical protein
VAFHDIYQHTEPNPKGVYDACPSLRRIPPCYEDAYQETKAYLLKKFQVTNESSRFVERWLQTIFLRKFIALHGRRHLRNRLMRRALVPVEDMVLLQYAIRDANDKFNRLVGKVIAIDGNVVTLQSPGKEYKVGSTSIIPLDNYFQVGAEWTESPGGVVKPEDSSESRPDRLEKDKIEWPMNILLAGANANSVSPKGMVTFRSAVDAERSMVTKLCLIQGQLELDAAENSPMSYTGEE